MFGDMGSAFIPFEKDFTLIIDDPDTVDTDGYVVKDPATEIDFKGTFQTPLGVAQFNQNLTLGTNGMKYTGDVVLYYRLGQTDEDGDDLPTFKIGDKVRDAAGIIWKIHSIEDYSNFNVMLYGLSKVD
jgi:hypothetical protein